VAIAGPAIRGCFQRRHHGRHLHVARARHNHRLSLTPPSKAAQRRNGHAGLDQKDTHKCDAISSSTPRA
jgi:hypothetical protein